MKIGILTFHCAHNYGAVLQAYALQTYLKQQGFNVSIIDYRPDFLLTKRSLYNFKGFTDRSLFSKLKHLVGSLFIYRKKCRRYDAFEAFIGNKLNLVPVDQESFDICIVGSDQVWNLDITKGSNEFYGGYSNKVSAKYMITYAASLGNCQFTPKNVQVWEKYLTSFCAVSLREKSSISQFVDKFNMSVNHVMDPVFLLGPKVWKDISYPRSDRYVLVYQVHFDKYVLDIANKIAKERKCKVIQLTPRAIFSKNKSIYDCASVEDFVSLFQYAEYVVTTSFHGTAFSIINQRNFYTVKLCSTIDDRSLNLLTSLGLEDRAIAKGKVLTIDDISYDTVNQKLDKLRELSQQYLLSNILS